MKKAILLLLLVRFYTPGAQAQSYLKDITMQGEPVPSVIKNTIRGVTFDNVMLNGKRVVAEADMPLRSGSKGVENATFRPIR